MKAIAESIVAGVGKVGTVVDGKSGGSIFVFEETHLLPAGQIEIAICSTACTRVIICDMWGWKARSKKTGAWTRPGITIRHLSDA